ncbi:MAG: hypothetical protein IPP69_02365 [Flavobacteriales bacterium]|nr:hypothetical protein [Flavobacteriales bacterium]
MKNLYFFLILFSSIVISSCRDKQPTEPADAPDPYFHVKVVEVGTEVPVPDADVYLFDEASSGSGIALHGHMFSDENGEVTWLKTDSIDKICVQKDGYFNSCGTGLYLTEPPVSQGKYFLYPHAWIKFSIQDDEPLNPEVYIGHTINEPGSGSWNGIAPGSTQIVLQMGNTDEFFRVVQLVSIGVAEFDTIANEAFTVNIPAFDTLEFVYHY